MTVPFPSREFDEAVAAVCHGSASDAQVQSLNELLRRDPAARDEYLLRVELHSRLASDPDLFADLTPLPTAPPPDAALNRLDPAPGLAPAENVRPARWARRPAARRLSWALALAAGVTLLAAGWWGWREWAQPDRRGATSKAIAMLSHVVEAEWATGEVTPRLGAPLEPGPLRLNSGLAQIVFYSGARVVIEGPAELHLVSPGEATCSAGRLIAEVPPQAKGFRIGTPEMNVTDLGTVFGVDVRPRRTELHVFKGGVEFQAITGPSKHQQTLREGKGAVAEAANPPQLIPANSGGFASLFDLQTKSSAAEVLRHEQWRASSSRLNEDPSLLVHFDFEPTDPSAYRLPNASQGPGAAPDATIVGCQWTEGRWPDKRALEFRGVSDRVRLEVPGTFDALTFTVWLRVQGLDRQINSLFMSDGFEAGTVHWSLRQDGVLGLTAIGSEPGRYQICASPPALTLDQFGLWVHLAAVIDGRAKQVVHYCNGVRLSEHALRISPPFRTAMGELGNWNAQGFPKNDPFMIRNFSGAMDEFCLFSRALTDDEIHALYSGGKPQPESPHPHRH